MRNQLNWDIRFLRMAELVSSWSKDPSTKTGAVIVRPNGLVASVGFNGFPQNMPDSEEFYANREEKYSRIVHCEMNAVLLAEGSVRGSTLYTWPFASCDRCCVAMMQAGIARFVYPSLPAHLVERWGAALSRTEKYLKEAGIELREIGGLRRDE